EGLGHALVDVPAPAAHLAQLADQGDGPVGEAGGLIGDEQVRVEGVARAQPVAVGAHAVRAVEAEQLRAGRLITAVAVGAGVVGGEEDVVGWGLIGNPTPPAPSPKRGGGAGRFLLPSPPL